MVYIRLKSIIDESFQDYKKPSMMLAMCKCDWKCLKEQCLDYSICQNSELVKQENINKYAIFALEKQKDLTFKITKYETKTLHFYFFFYFYTGGIGPNERFFYC